LFGAATGNASKQAYILRNNGNLLIRDTWYEGNAGANWMHMDGTNSGTFTLDAGKIAADPPGGLPIAPVNFSGFEGKATFIATSFAFDDRASVTGSNPNANVLLMGVLGGSKPPLELQSADAHAAVIESREFVNDPAGTKPTPDIGNPSPQWIRDMLKQTREATPQPLLPYRDGVTDIRIERVVSINSQNATRIQH